MSDVRTYHSQAIGFANKAHEAINKGDVEGYHDGFSSAYEFESKAFELIKDNIDAEPTRSIILKSATFAAFNAGMLSEALSLISLGLQIKGINPSIKDELLLLTRKIGGFHSDQSSEDMTYLNFLREKAINLKIEPSQDKHGSAIKLDNVFKVLKAVKTSLDNYIEINFEREFGLEEDANANILTNLKKDAQPLIVDLAYRSFGASISSDFVVMSKHYNSKIDKWKRTLFDRFRDDVIHFDYESVESLDILKGKFSDVERKKIYSPFVSILQSSSGLKLSLTDKNYSVVKTFRPFSRATKNVLSPKIDIVDSGEISLERKYIEVTKDNLKGKHTKTLTNEQLESAEFSVQIAELKNDTDELILKEPIEITVDYSKPQYSIDYELFEFILTGSSYEYVINEFVKKFISEYNRLIVIEKPSHQENLLIEVFRQKVFTRAK
ncbi:hypothetical protein [Marinoscillum sp.]|uniref:hypothetical protein n=1 Tax=Marinoscillum sp. TaxID=2024838 RepID=UPI003BAB578C